MFLALARMTSRSVSKFPIQTAVWWFYSFYCRLCLLTLIVRSRQSLTTFSRTVQFPPIKLVSLSNPFPAPLNQVNGEITWGVYIHCFEWNLSSKISTGGIDSSKFIGPITYTYALCDLSYRFILINLNYILDPSPAPHLRTSSGLSTRPLPTACRAFFPPLLVLLTPFFETKGSCKTSSTLEAEFSGESGDGNDNDDSGEGCETDGWDDLPMHSEDEDELEMPVDAEIWCKFVEY